MRVLQVVQYFETGGLEQMVYLLARGLKKHKIECQVLAYVGDGSLRERFDASSIPTIFWRGKNSIRHDLPGKILGLIRKEKFDIVHSHHLGPLMYSAIPAAMSGRPHIHTEHSVEFYDNKRRRLIAKLLARKATLVAVSSAIAGWHTENLGTTCQVIENGVDVPEEVSAGSKNAAKQALGINSNQFVVGCVARIAKEKRLDLLLRGFGQFVRGGSDAKLVVVGDGPERSGLMTLTDELGLSDRVHWLGNRDDVYQILPAFDLIGLTSSREGLPLSLLEGMAHSVPVVATAVGGIPQLLQNGGGSLVQTPTPQNVAEAFASYCTDEKKRVLDGKYARELVVDSYSVDTMVQRYAQLYQENTHLEGLP